MVHHSMMKGADEEIEESKAGGEVKQSNQKRADLELKVAEPNITGSRCLHVGDDDASS